MSASTPAVAKDPLRYFRIESRELVDQLSRGVLDLTRDGGDREPVARLLRHAHTLKGAARVVRQGEIADAAHALEELLIPHRDGTEPVSPQTVGALLTLTDRMSVLAGALQSPDAPEPLPSPPAAAPPASTTPEPSATAEPTARTPAAATATPEVAPKPAAAPATAAVATPQLMAAPVRSDSADIDELLDAVGEAHARFASLRRQVATVERARRAADAITEQLRFRGGQQDGGDGRTAGMATRLAADLTVLGRQLTESVEQVERELDDIRGRAERLRLVPVSTVLTTLHRAVYDAAGAEGKQVLFDSRGGDLRLDPHVLSLASGALLHVVRNAVSHGVETKAERLAAGKPAAGHVAVEVHRRGTNAAFRCRDDGRGFDLGAVRRQAEAQGLVTSGAEADVRELMRLLMHGGISTAGEVTGISGRGIGLDAVRDVAEQLGGEVNVSTEPGSGTTVELVVPLSLVSLSGLVVEAAGTVASLPLDAVRTCVLLDAVAVAAAGAAGAMAHDGHVIAFLLLARVLAPAVPQAVADGVVAVILAAGERTVAVGVDRLLGTSALVVRPLPELAPASAVVNGLSIDAEGNPRIVLDPHGLAAAAGRLTGGARDNDPAGGGTGVDDGTEGTAPARAPVLVVDDSLTTRMLERSILESAGYQVELAASAEEALERVKLRRYALFLVDIDMPGIDGFTFVALTREDPVLRETPAILVSSRASAEDRRRGAEAGASAYMVKSEFNQEELLGHIRDLVGQP